MKQRTELHLKLGSMDPLSSSNLALSYIERIQKEFPSFPTAFALARYSLPGPSPFLVQFHTQAFPEIRRALEENGITVLFPFPEQAFLVSVPSEAAAEALKKMPFVRWAGEYIPLFKIGRDIMELLNSEKAASETLRFNVMVTQRGPILQTLVSRLVEQQLGGSVVALTPEGFRMEVEISLSQLPALLAFPEVLYVDLWTPFEEDMDIARLNGGLDYASKVAGYNGEGVRAEVMDSGLYTSHTDFASLNIMIHGGNGGSTSHGTSVFGIVFGDGYTNPNALGCMCKANASIFAAYSLIGGTYTRYRHTEELVDPEGEYRAIFQTNSWGSSQTSSYTSISAEMDDIIFLNDITILQSQSNTGNRNSRPQAWAKNILSVGAFYHRNTLTRADDSWNRGASIGPAEDGRQKPDLANFYDEILTTSNSNNGYTQFGGTSGATPITAGHVGIFYQMWADGVFSGAPGQERDVFDTRPHSATAKAAMINTARPFYFDESSTDNIRVHQGWGTADLAELHGAAQLNKWRLPILVDETDPIAPQEVLSYQVTVSSSSSGPQYLKVTLNYLDPMPSPSSSKQLINNLDLQVTSPSGVDYWGGYGLDKGICSEEGGEPSNVDTVENVFVCVAEPGTWTVSVIGTEIVQDTYFKTKDVDVVFSLVATTGRRS